jgi:hypothetical protein
VIDRPAMRRAVSASWQEEAEKAEAMDREDDRAERHHEVLCLVLKAHWTALMTAPGAWPMNITVAAENFNRNAKLAADLAYPPPEAKQTPDINKHNNSVAAERAASDHANRNWDWYKP